MSDWAPVEFDCSECGRHIVMICGDVTTPPLCGACLMIPGWLKIKAVREIIDPDHDGRELCDG